jgi:hypothetical protein
MRKPRATRRLSSPKTCPSPERAAFHVALLGLRMVRALNRWATHRNHPTGGPMSGCLRLSPMLSGVLKARAELGLGVPGSAEPQLGVGRGETPTFLAGSIGYVRYGRPDS